MRKITLQTLVVVAITLAATGTAWVLENHSPHLLSKPLPLPNLHSDLPQTLGTSTGIIQTHQGPFEPTEFLINSEWSGVVDNQRLFVYAGKLGDLPGGPEFGGVRVYFETLADLQAGKFEYSGQYLSSDLEALSIVSVSGQNLLLTAPSGKNYSFNVSILKLRSIKLSHSTQIGNTCKSELQTRTRIENLGNEKILICVKETKGLYWEDIDLVKVDKRLNELLPSCKIGYVKALPHASISQKRIFLKLATNYFSKRNLLPIKLDSVDPISINLAKLGPNVCSNGMGEPLGDRTGFVPSGATEAWEALVIHKKNEIGQDNFLQIVLLHGSYKVVGASTSP